jgi:linearmycin/streptolysin S transport system permease protein
MRYAWLICVKDLRQRMRDRTAVIGVIGVPLVLTAVMGLALGGSQSFRMRLAIADLDSSQLSRAFIAFVQHPLAVGVVEVRRMDSRRAAEAAVTSHEADCAVVIDPGFARAALAGKSAPVEILVPASAQFARLMTDAVVRDFLNRIAAGTDPRTPIASVIPLSPGGMLRTVDFFAASMTVLFLTFGILSGVRAMQAEVDTRTIARLMASPAEPTTILAGKFAALLILGLIQMSVMIAATSILFGTRWGNPIPVAALVATSVLMAIGMTAFFMSLARNADQGQGLASVAILLLAVVGGQFLPPQGLPDVFETLSRLTPNGQAYRGFVDLGAAAAAGSLRTIAEPLLVTAAVGMAGIAFAALRAREALRRLT